LPTLYETELEKYRAVRPPQVAGAQDRAWRALLYIATSRPDLFQLVRPHMDYAAGTVDFDALAGRLHAFDEQLVDAARSMLEGDYAIRLHDLLSVDDSRIEVFIDAIRAYSYRTDRR